MENPAQTIGIVGVALGTAMNLVRTAANRRRWNFPAWLDDGLGIVGILLIAVCLTLLLRSFVELFGAALPPDSPWPATLLYCVVSASLIFAAGYLPYRVSPRVSAYKTEWEPAIAESFYLHLGDFEAGKNSTIRVKIVATEQGTLTARLIAQIMTHYGWKIEVNADDGSHVFPAPTSFQGTHLRYRASRQFEGGTPHLSGIVAALADYPQTEHFPEDDKFNFAQIEIGNVPEYYSGPGRFMNDYFR
jgi:hypothetical protein